MPKSILIIEDDSDFLNDLSVFLDGYFQIYTSADSCKGMSLLNSKHPDLCLVDIQLLAQINDRSEWEGLFLAKEIQKTAGKSLPIILMSRFDLPESPVDIKDIPFLKKPFKIDKLMNEINKLLPPAALDI